MCFHRLRQDHPAGRCVRAAAALRFLGRAGAGQRLGLAEISGAGLLLLRAPGELARAQTAGPQIYTDPRHTRKPDTPRPQKHTISRHIWTREHLLPALTLHGLDPEPCPIPQNDTLLSGLTVRESLTFTALLATRESSARPLHKKVGDPCPLGPAGPRAQGHGEVCESRKLQLISVPSVPAPPLSLLSPAFTYLELLSAGAQRGDLLPYLLGPVFTFFDCLSIRKGLPE